MGHKFAEIAFTPKVKMAQTAQGSRDSYARLEAGADFNDRLGPSETAFIAARDSFYMATVGETGWPYIQHRGGPPGFVRVLDEKHIAFADFRGNRQYISMGNLDNDDRVALLLMDYPNRTRLKLLGRARTIDDTNKLARLAVPDYRARIERGVIVTIEAFDWNCSQHITPRYSKADMLGL